MPRYSDTFEIEPGSPQRPTRAAWWKSRFVLTLGLVVVLLAVVVVCNRDALLGQWHAEQARKKLEADEPQAAVEQISRAIERTPNEPRLYEVRGQLRLEIHDLEGALADFTRVVELADRYAPGYSGRSLALQRLKRHREAIDDLTRAIECSPTGSPHPWNQRAYARAIANLELPAAMSDIETALTLLAADKRLAKDPLIRAAYLDTRGFIRHRQGDQSQALADLNEAYSVTEKLVSEIKERLAQQPLSQRQVAREIESLHHNLAVMLHHRGLVFRALGKTAEADADLRRAEELGYNPDKGVF